MTKYKQRGASTFSLLLNLVMVALAITLAIKLIPRYLDNNSINSVITSLGEDSQLASYDDQQIRKKIQSRLTINNIREFDGKKITIKRDNGKLYIDADYEIRDNIFKNIDVVISFENHFETSIKSE